MKIHSSKKSNEPQNVSEHDDNKCEVKPYPVQVETMANTSAYGDIQGVVVKVEANHIDKKCIGSIAGVNTINPLNVNIVKVVSSANEESEMERKTIIEIKKKEEVVEHYSISETVGENTVDDNTVKVEDLKVEPSPSEEYTYL